MAGRASGASPGRAGGQGIRGHPGGGATSGGSRRGFRTVGRADGGRAAGLSRAGGGGSRKHDAKRPNGLETRRRLPTASDPGTTPTEDEPEPQDASAEDLSGSQTGASAGDEPAESDEQAPTAATQPLQSRRREGAQQAPEDRAPSSVTQGERRRWSRRQVRDRVLSSTGESWHPGLISYLRKGRGPQVDYDAFDYLAAVRKLDPLIRESIHGSGRRRGLAEIMDRRRHGAVDPWRRPRKQRRGDTGEIDLEHPERLITDPASAFLRGVRVAREDRQRDFASAILLDISGSMVQRGFPTKKFDRLVEAAVIFIEIHERLGFPYAVLSFSTEAVLHWRFEQSAWTAAGIPSEAAYRPRDHSQIVRTSTSWTTAKPTTPGRCGGR